MPPSAISVPARRASSRAQTLNLLRKVHLYFGLFLAPALLFFAFTGAVQTLSLHEAAGASYAPPAWLARLAQLHKNQTLAVPERRGPRPEAPGSGDRPHGVSAQPAAPPSPPPNSLESKQRRHLPEKIFFLVVSLGLFTSTLTGVYMAYRYDRNRLLVTGLLVAGVVIPLLLVRF